MMAIETVNLSKTFGEVTAVRGLDLNVPERSVFGFLGPNGAGKTTTIRLLLGLLRPGAGAARIFGQDVQRRRMQALRSVGAIIETPSFYDHLSGRENLDITRRILGLPPTEIDRTLGLVGLRDAQRRRAGAYSLGMRQRLGLARALLGSPRLLVLDEPTNGLDPDGIQEMRNFIRALPDSAGTTVLVSSHILSEVEQTATHVGLMSQGRLVLQDALANVLGDGGMTVGLDVDDRDRAAGVLSALPVDILPHAGDGMRVRLRPDAPLGGGRDAAAAMNAALVGAGIRVFRLAPQARRLEDIYMTHVGGTGSMGGTDAAAADQD